MPQLQLCGKLAPLGLVAVLKLYEYALRLQMGWPRGSGVLQHAAESLSRRTCCLRRLLQSCMRVMASAMTIVVTSCATLEGIQRMQVADLSRGHRLCSLQASHSFDCGSWSTKVLQGAAGGRDGHQRGSGYTLSKSSFITKKDHLLEDRWVSCCKSLHMDKAGLQAQRFAKTAEHRPVMPGYNQRQ